MFKEKKAYEVLAMGLLFVFSVLLLIFNSFNVKADTIKLYEPTNAMELTGSITAGYMNLNTTGGGANYQYQYWIKEKVVTDNFEYLANEETVTDNYSQYIWKMIREFNTQTSYSLQMPQVDSYKDIQGKYNILVRVKDAESKIVDNIYKVFTPSDMNEVLITGVKVNGKEYINDDVYIDKDSVLDINIATNITDNVTYSLKYNGNVLASQYENCVFEDVDTVNFVGGSHIFTISADNGNTYDELDINVYVCNSYLKQQQPVIKSLTGVSDANGVTDFTMKLSYADGNIINATDAGNFTINLNYNNTIYTPKSYSEDAINKVLNAEFQIDFGVGKYGIYRINGSVARKGLSGVNGKDDEIIIYYDGYTREVEVFTQTSDAQLQGGKYYSPLGTTINITASGTIGGLDSSYIRYAFYREDASGWVLIRDYSQSGELAWTPIKEGNYIIQARIMDVNAGSYEKTVNKTYIIGAPSVNGSFDIEIYDYNTKSKAVRYIAGMPYKIIPNYDGTDNVLYRYTITNANLGTVYLNSYTPNPYYIFVPNKADNYILTVRVINVNNYGYKDLDDSVQINSILDVKILDSGFDTFISDDVTNLVAGNTNYSVSLNTVAANSYSGNNSLKVTVKSDNAVLSSMTAEPSFTYFVDLGNVKAGDIISYWVYMPEFAFNSVSWSYINKQALPYPTGTERALSGDYYAIGSWVKLTATLTADSFTGTGLVKFYSDNNFLYDGTGKSNLIDTTRTPATLTYYIDDITLTDVNDTPNYYTVDGRSILGSYYPPHLTSVTEDSTYDYSGDGKSYKVIAKSTLAGTAYRTIYLFDFGSASYAYKPVLYGPIASYQNLYSGYTIKMWIYCDTQTTFTFSRYLLTPTPEWVNESPQVVSANTWTQITYTIPADNTSKYLILTVSAANTTYYIDGMTVEK